MLYYRVPACLDGKPCYKRGAPGAPRIPNGYYLIEHELLTAAECKKLNAPTEKLFPIRIKKTDTYRLFGARFAK